MKKIMMDLIHVKNVYKNVSNYQKVKRKMFKSYFKEYCSKCKKSIKSRI